MMMNEIAGAAWVLPLTFALQGISAALILARLVRGPRDGHRAGADHFVRTVGRRG